MNVMNYRQLSDELCRDGFDTLRFEYMQENEFSNVQTFIKELMNFIAENDDVLSMRKVIIGHGVKGCIEAQLLLHYLKADKTVLLNGAGLTVKKSTQISFVNNAYVKRWIYPWKRSFYQKVIRKFDSSGEFGGCRRCFQIHCRNGYLCEGYCEEGKLPYFNSLCKYTNAELYDMLRTENAGKILAVFMDQSSDYSRSIVNDVKNKLQNEVEISEYHNMYETCRVTGKRDYTQPDDVYLVKNRKDMDTDRRILQRICNFISE